VAEESLVAIHDGVRPLVSQRIIIDSYRLAEQYGSAVPVMPLNETLREIRDGSSRLVDRSCLFSVQTPQTFRAGLIKEAYLQEFRQEFTDDGAVLEAAGHKVHFFPGDPRNIKITWQQDLVMAGKLLEP
jgi:2-C-methyl-D-erythritol 4-phosphate cytidylyltransferase